MKTPLKTLSTFIGSVATLPMNVLSVLRGVFIPCCSLLATCQHKSNVDGMILCREDIAATGTT